MATSVNLELIKNQTKKSGPTLQSVIDYTVTPMGSRLLRMSILQPLCVESLIQNRLDALEGTDMFSDKAYSIITELNDNESIVSQLRSILKGLPDLDRLLSSVRINFPFSQK